MKLGQPPVLPSPTTLPAGSLGALIAEPTGQLDFHDGTGWRKVAGVAPAVRVYRNVATALQSVPDSTWTALGFDAEEFDSEGFHDNATNNTRLTVPAGRAGRYMIVGIVEFTASATGRRIVSLWKNGVVSAIAEVEYGAAPAASASTKVPIMAVADLVAGDYVELGAYQSSGGALNVNRGPIGSHLEMFAVELKPVNPSGSGARVYNSVTTAVTTSTAVVLSFDTERYDTDGYHDATNPTRMTIPKTGRYRVGASVQFPANATGKREVDLRVNGTSYIGVDARQAVTSAGDTTICTVEVEAALNAGDYVEAVAIQTSGVSLTLPASTVAGGYPQEFWISALETFTSTLSETALVSLIAAVTVANSAAETRLLGFTLPANFMSAGTTFRITADGVAGTTTVAPTMTWRIRIGSVTLTGNIPVSIAPTPAVSQTNKPWRVDILVTVRTGGAAGTVIGNGICINELSTTAPNFSKGSGITATVAVDTTAAKEIELTFQWGTANAANTLTVHNATIEVVKR